MSAVSLTHVSAQFLLEEQGRRDSKVRCQFSDVALAELSMAVQYERRQSAITDQSAEVRAVHAALLHQVFQRIEGSEVLRLEGMVFVVVGFNKQSQRIEIVPFAGIERAFGPDCKSVKD